MLALASQTAFIKGLHNISSFLVLKPTDALKTSIGKLKTPDQLFKVLCFWVYW